MVDPLSVIGLAPIVYNTAAKAWSTVSGAISFPEDSEDLMIRLETARARFDIWASFSGLEAGRLESRLMPFDSLIERSLGRIDELFSNTDQLKDRYGLTLEEVSEPDAEKQASRVMRMRRSLRAANARLKHTAGEPSSQEHLSQLSINPGKGKRLRWAIKDKDTFESFVVLVEVHVDGLQKLLTESQIKIAQQEVTRFGLQLVGSSSDTQSLSNLQKVGEATPERSGIDIHFLAQLKIISCQTGRVTFGSVKAGEFSLDTTPLADRKKVRFLQRGAINRDVCYMFEKKEYDSNISEQNKDLLESRIQRLVSLLSAPHADRELHTLQAVGYVDDPELHCWWLAFRFPLPPMISTSLPLSQRQPISLRELYSIPFKPPLEKRYQLVRRVAHTFAKLYGSDWMHKSITSQNIIFPQLSEQNSLNSFRAINSALVQGFGYSRQQTEAQTIDRGKVLGDLEAAIYRHPNYQGDAASGYKTQYDIYSFGLILFEIALWAPLLSLFVPPKGPVESASVQLSPVMKHFHQEEALELKRRVMIRVDKELAFRVGTKYCEVVRWCLSFYQTPLDNKQPWQAGMEFYNNVVIPLEELSNE